MPFISVLIRLYNGIEFLEESLDSVLNQTYKDFEVIIGVNGHGFTSETYDLAKAIVERKTDSRVILRNYPYVRGGADALNALIADADASAEWVAILDVDDKWHPEKLECQVPLTGASPEVSIIGTLCQYFGSSEASPQIPWGYIDPELFKSVNPMIHSSVLIKRDTLYYTDFCGLDDYDLWCRLVKQGKRFYTVPNTLTYHRLHSASHYNAGTKQDPAALRKHYFP